MVEIIKDFRNELLKRREVEVVMGSIGNPGIDNSKKLIIEEFKSSEEVIVIKNLKSEFGKKYFIIDAFIYDSFEDLKKIEPRNKKEEARLAEEAKKKAVEEKKKAEEEKKKAEEDKPAEDKPAEDKPAVGVDK